MSDRNLIEPINLPILNWVYRLSRLPLRRLWLLVAVVGIIRTGIGFYGSRMLEVSQSLPKPIDAYQSFNLPGPILARILGITSTNGWIVLHLIVLPIFVLIVGKLLIRKVTGIEERRFLIIALGCSALPSTLISQVGHYDTYLFLGSSIFALTTGYLSGFILAAFLGITHFEQSMFMYLSLAFISLALGTRQTKRLILAACTGVAVRFGLNFWAEFYDIAVPTRWSLMITRQGFITNMNLRLFFVHIFSFYGAAWALVISLVAISKPKIRKYLFLALLAIPFIGFFISFDGTRIFANLAWPAFLTVCIWATHDSEIFKKISQTNSITLLIFFLTPGIVTHIGGVQVVYADIVRKVLEVLRII